MPSDEERLRALESSVKSFSVMVDEVVAATQDFNGVVLSLRSAGVKSASSAALVLKGELSALSREAGVA